MTSFPSSLPTLEVHTIHRSGALAIDATLTLDTPWSVLFGPSGSGKSTLLRILAGLIRPAAGRIALGNQILFDNSAKFFLPAHKRPIRTAPQAVRLLPHRSVEQNITYAEHASIPNARELLEELAFLFRIELLLPRMPRLLSGGEAQRVSVARAVFAAAAYKAPVLLLLDEPFTGLDLPLRDHLLATLPPWLAARNIPVLSVTHDIAETFQLEATVFRIAEGRIVQKGPAPQVLADERHRLLSQLRQPAFSDIIAKH